MIDIILKNFDNPDEVRSFDKGKFELVKFSNMTIGKASYEPGWKWSRDVSPLSGTEFCEVEHLGMVLSGSATVVQNGEIHILKKEIVLCFYQNRTIAGLSEIKYVSFIFRSENMQQPIYGVITYIKNDWPIVYEKYIS